MIFLIEINFKLPEEHICLGFFKICVHTHIYIHRFEKFSFLREKKVKDLSALAPKSCEISNAILVVCWCSCKSLSTITTSSGCPQYTAPHLLILASKNDHSSAASCLSPSLTHHPYSRLTPHLPSSLVTSILPPSLLSYGASSFNYFANV